MRPTLVEQFRDHEATFVADEHDYTDDFSIDEIVARAGVIDFLMKNFAGLECFSPASELVTNPNTFDNEDLQGFFDEMTWGHGALRARCTALRN